MRNFIKKFALAFFILPLFLTSHAHAQTSPEQSIKDFYKNFPEVYIDEVSLPKTEYAAGETVTGFFIIRNAKKFDVENISYDIALAGNYDANKLAGVLYEKVRQGPITLKAGETQKIDFSYKIPEALSGTNFGIEVSAVLQNGVTLGWRDAFIKVTGAKTALNVKNVLLAANGKTYTPDAGPTIKKNDPASLKITLTNPSAADISVTPVVTLTKFIAGGTPIETKGEAVTIPKKSDKEIDINLNTSYDAAIYVGEIVFADETDTKLTPTVGFRYIIGGDIVNFQSVSADKTVLQTGDKFNVSILYSGAPIDIDNDLVQPKDNTVNLSVKIFNEADASVAEYTNPNFNFNSDNKLTVPLSATTSAKALRAEIVATRAGAVVAQYKNNLSANYAEAQKAYQDSQKTQLTNNPTLLIILTVVLLIILALIFKFLKKKKPPVGMMGY